MHQQIPKHWHFFIGTRRLARLCAGLGALWLTACASTSAPPTPPPSNTPKTPAPDSCSLERVKPEILKIPEAGPSELHARFELPDEPYLWKPAPLDQSLSQFREALQIRLGREPEARFLIEHQRSIFDTMPQSWKGEATNATLLLEGRAGTISPIGCLEAMLWKHQAARFPMLEHPTEFGAFILRGRQQVRVYFSSADLVGQKVRSTIMELLQADIQAGFRLSAHLHNHPFLFDRKVGDRSYTQAGAENDFAGALAPSMTDIHFYKNLHEDHGVEEVWVTNGLETSRFRAEELKLMVGR